MIRAVVDTNVLVSGFISPFSHPREVIKRWRGGAFELVTSYGIIEEVSRTLYSPRIRIKYHLTDGDIQTLVLALMHQSECVPGVLTLTGVAPDPGDDKVISCAVEGRAGFIVTGDKPLQKLGRHDDIAIVSAEAFIRILDRDRR